jgi:DNA-binding NarL/FixJ family response regulator
MEQTRGMMGPIRVESERQVMHTPEEVSAILELHRLGWGSKRIARELKIDKSTLKRYLRAGG